MQNTDVDPTGTFSFVISLLALRSKKLGGLFHLVAIFTDPFLERSTQNFNTNCKTLKTRPKFTTLPVDSAIEVLDSRASLQCRDQTAPSLGLRSNPDKRHLRESTLLPSFHEDP